MTKHRTTHISKTKVLKVDKVDLTGFTEWKSSIDFSSPKKVKKMLLEHFADGDHETFFDLLYLYLKHVGKTKLSKKTKIPERTLYNFLTKEHKTSSENIFKIMKYLTDEENAA